MYINVDTVCQDANGIECATESGTCPDFNTDNLYAPSSSLEAIKEKELFWGRVIHIVVHLVRSICKCT
jgi:hypothetical protein